MTDDLVRCALPGTGKDGRMDSTCVGCERRTVPAKDGAPVMCGRIEPGSYCQDRVPPAHTLFPGWLVQKP